MPVWDVAAAAKCPLAEDGVPFGGMSSIFWTPREDLTPS